MMMPMSSPLPQASWLIPLVALAACSGARDTATGTTQQEVPAAVIDTDATLADIEPGRGVGLFVEYASGGHWRVYVTCDTLESELGCQWDVIVSSSSAITAVQTEGEGPEVWLEPLRDSAGKPSSALRFVSETTVALEGVRFATEAGTPIRVDVLLDGVAEGRYTYWVGGGAVHTGAPSSVIDLLPTAP